MPSMGRNKPCSEGSLAVHRDKQALCQRYDETLVWKPMYLVIACATNCPGKHTADSTARSGNSSEFRSA